MFLMWGNKCKRRIMWLLCFSVFILLPSHLFSSTTNLLKNPSFESVTDNKPDYWEEDGWIMDKSVSNFSIGTDGPHSGNSYAVIQSVSANDARYIQRVAVEPNTVYKMSGWIRTENVGSDNTGANITILQDFYVDHSEDIKGTNYVEFFIRTKADQKELVVAARLGGFSQTNTGTASFDDLEISEELHVVNEDDISKSSLASKYISNLATNGTPQTNEVKEQPPANANSQKGIPFGYTLFFTLLFMCIVFGIYYFFIYKNSELKLDEKTLNWIFFILMFIGLVIRLIISYNFEGYHNDTESFKAWAVRASTYPLNQFYDPNLFADYPPGYIYILSILGHIGKFLGMDYNSQLYIMLLKIPAMLAELCTAFLVFWIARNKLNTKAAFGLGVMYLFNPAIIFTSSFWGQVDSIPALLGFLIIYFILKERYWIASLILGFDIIIKLQSGVLLFILIFALIEKKDIKAWILSIVAGFATFWIPLIPFIPAGENIFFIIGIITKTVSQYAYASVNAFNLMGLFGGNWVPLSNTFFIFSYAIWGYILIGLSIVFISILYFKMKSESKIFFVTGVFYILAFMLFPSMHERYGYTALIVFMMSFIYMNKKRLFFLFAGFSLTMYVNIAYVLDFFMRGEFVYGGDPVGIIIAILNLGLTGYMIKLGIDFINEHKPEIAGSGNTNETKNGKNNITRKYNHGKLRKR
jgi:dolichyl-phosphate-mannose-protein mannosyltransferase